MGKNELFNNISETTGLSRESCEKFFGSYNAIRTKRQGSENGKCYHIPCCEIR